jgi:hypothetical protein
VSHGPYTLGTELSMLRPLLSFQRTPKRLSLG